MLIHYEAITLTITDLLSNLYVLYMKWFNANTVPSQYFNHSWLIVHLLYSLQNENKHYLN